MRDQAFSLSDDLALSKIDLRQTCRKTEIPLAEGERQGGVGEEPNHTTARKPARSINHSELSDNTYDSL